LEDRGILKKGGKRDETSGPGKPEPAPPTGDTNPTALLALLLEPKVHAATKVPDGLAEKKQQEK